MARTHGTWSLARLALFAIASVAAPSLARAGGCTVAVSGVSFGAYSVFDGRPTSTTGVISYTCASPVSPPVITLGRGRSATFMPRTLSGARGALAYNLYLDAAGTRIWGDGGSGTSVYAAGVPADGQRYDVVIYGHIPARQNVAAGAYSDLVVVTVEF